MQNITFTLRLFTLTQKIDHFIHCFVESYIWIIWNESSPSSTDENVFFQVPEHVAHTRILKFQIKLGCCLILSFYEKCITSWHVRMYTTIYLCMKPLFQKFSSSLIITKYFATKLQITEIWYAYHPWKIINKPHIFDALSFLWIPPSKYYENNHYLFQALPR